MNRDDWDILHSLALEIEQETGATVKEIKRRAVNAMHCYRITLGDLWALYQEQGGACAICGKAGPFCGRGCLHIDHNHETEEIRGLLCGRCNRALGMAGDNREKGITNYLDGAPCAIERQEKTMVATFKTYPGKVPNLPPKEGETHENWLARCVAEWQKRCDQSLRAMGWGEAAKKDWPWMLYGPDGRAVYSVAVVRNEAGEIEPDKARAIPISDLTAGKA